MHVHIECSSIHHPARTSSARRYETLVPQPSYKNTCNGIAGRHRFGAWFRQANSVLHRFQSVQGTWGSKLRCLLLGDGAGSEVDTDIDLRSGLPSGVPCD